MLLVGLLSWGTAVARVRQLSTLVGALFPSIYGVLIAAGVVVVLFFLLAFQDAGYVLDKLLDQLYQAQRDGVPPDVAQQEAREELERQGQHIFIRSALLLVSALVTLGLLLASVYNVLRGGLSTALATCCLGLGFAVGVIYGVAVLHGMVRTMQRAIWRQFGPRQKKPTPILGALKALVSRLRRK